jgi:hypothetical protein
VALFLAFSELPLAEKLGFMFLKITTVEIIEMILKVGMTKITGIMLYQSTPIAITLALSAVMRNEGNTKYTGASK